MTSLMDESLASRSEENDDDDEEMEEFDEEALLDSEEMADSPGLSATAAAAAAGSSLHRAAATGEEIKCSACEFTSRSRVAVQRHERLTHLKKKFFRCVKCNYVTHVKARYTKHVKYHSMPMIKCDLCEFRTPYKWNLDRHLKNHMGGGMYKCSLCNFTAHIKQSLTVHIQNHHLSPDKARSLRRRNKVGASDELSEAATVDPDEMELLRLEREADREDFFETEAKTANEMTQFETMNEEEVASKAAGLKITLRKIKSPSKNNSSDGLGQQDDKNNQAQVKTLKCHLCSFQTVWENELSLHEAKSHAADQTRSNSGLSESARPVHPAPGPATGSPAAVKKARPIPNLIPITNLNAEKVTPAPTILKIPQIHKRPVNDSTTSSPILEAVGLFAKGSGNDSSPSRLDTASPAESSAKGIVNLSKKSKTSFFDQLAEKLASNMENETKNQQQTTSPLPVISRPLPAPNNGSLSSRCQHCRQRCKTRADLLSHLKQCPQALAASAVPEKRPEEIHPMENKVFVWNRTEEPELEAMELEPEEKRPSSVAGSDASEASLVGVETAPGIGAVTGGAGSTGFVTDSGRASVRRVYRCPQCSFWATTASRFHVHMVGHTNTKPFECSHCAYRSNWRWDITKHIKLKSARDPAHGQAKVVLLDASGERHYDQYDRYLVMMRVTEASGTTHGRLNEAAAAAAPAGSSSKRPRKAGSLSPSPSASPSPAASPAPHQPPASESLSFNIPGLSPAAVASLASSLASYAALHGADVLQSIGKFSRTPLATDFSSTLRQPAALSCSEAGETDNGNMAAENRALEDEDDTMKKTGNHVPPHTNEARRTVWKCKRCLFKDANRDAVLQHIRQLHYQGVGSDSNNALTHSSSLPTGRDEAAASLLPPPPPGAAPIPAFRCGVCNQASNWKHVIQRHCRLKHNGNIQVIENKANEEDGPELAREVESPQRPGRGQFGAPPPAKKSRTSAPLGSYLDEDSMGYIMHPDRQQYICSSCPFVCKSLTDIELHRQQHKPAANRPLKCTLCPFYVSEKNELAQHLLVHGLRDMTVDSLESPAAPTDQESVGDVKATDEAGPSQEDGNRRHRCSSCPYISDSKSQFVYHKQFHRPRGAPYKCPRCSYNVSRRHLLNQHLKVHGLPPLDGDTAFGDSEQYGTDSEGDLGSEAEVEAEALEAMEDLDTATPSPSATCTSEPNGSSGSSTDGFVHLGLDPATLPRLPDDATIDMADVPLTWVSRGNKFFKMFKCRFCPHVNVRKANIQEHEKRHRTESSTKPGSSENLHACAQCNYRCNNAGVLSAHVKVHQNILGIVHALAHPHQSDEEQLRELASKAEPAANHESAPQPKLNLLLGKSSSSPDSSANPEKVLQFCPHCPARFLVEAELVIHQRFHGLKLPYRCDFCSYTARQEHHLLAHWKVHNKEYQERTNGLMKMYKISDKYPQPTVLAVQTNTGVVQEEEAMDLSSRRSSGGSAPGSTTQAEKAASPKLSSCPSCPAKFSKDVALQYHISLHGSEGPFKCRYCDYAVKAQDNLLKHEKLHCGVALPSPPRIRKNTEVPLSGLDLVLRREEHVDDPAVEEAELLSSPKNGKSRGKRFKCPKCPSAFEKKEQFRIHSSLHGSKQRYRCEKCDYAVKYYTNFLQHVRKHKEHDEAKHNGELHESDSDMNESSPVESSAVVDLSCVDQQTTSERQQLWLHTKLSPPLFQDEQYAFQCQYCPHACATREELEQHAANHSINGAVGSYRCNFCDFTVAEQSGLQDHIKLHFMPKRGLKLDSYWKCANLEIWSEAVNANKSPQSQAVYDDNTKEEQEEEDSDEPDEDALFIDLSSGRPVKEDQLADCETLQE